MSKIDSNGLEHGKRGNNIYVGLNGQQVKKDLYRPTNPRTPAQQRHRAKLAFANRLSAHLAEAVNLGFARVAEASKAMTPRNAFVKANWDNGSLRWNEEATLWELCPERLLLANGPRHIPYGMTAEVEGNTLHIACPDTGLSHPDAVPDDQLIVAVYLPDLPALMLYRGPMRDHCSQCTFELPGELPQADMHVYAWFQATSFHRASGFKSQVRPDQSSPSLHLSTFHL
jgi:hypothetical protein